ncbi:MAG: hypothetical protein AAF411_28440 [Myxococcota bacterium]
MASVLRFACVALLLVACSDTPTFEERIPVREPECTETQSCPSGQVCLAERCFSSCSSDAECSTRESCTMGVCQPTGDGTDAGAFDAGNQEVPCNGSCSGGTPVCDIRNNVCVECVGEGDCDPGSFCDFARGACIEQASDGVCESFADCGSGFCNFNGGICQSTIVERPCAPCEGAGECRVGESCVLDEVRNERVCLVPCDPDGAACPTGFTCQAFGGADFCRPPIGGCTELERGSTFRGCASALDCLPRERSAPDEDGLCAEVAGPPMGAAPASLCQVPCDPTVGCPVFPGLPLGASVMCGPEGFCVVNYM